jgi:hypothetical protein
MGFRAHERTGAGAIVLAQHVDEEVVAAGDPFDQSQDGGCHALPAAAIHAAGDDEGANTPGRSSARRTMRVMKLIGF